MTDEDDRRYVDLFTAGAICGVGGDTVRRWIDSGDLAAVRLPGPRGRLRVYLPDLLLVLRPARPPRDRTADGGRP